MILLLTSLPLAAQQLYMPRNVKAAYAGGFRSMDGKPGAKYFQNKSTHNIKISVAPPNRRVTGSEDIVYKNNRPITLDNIFLRFELNVHAPEAMRDMPVEATELTADVVIDEYAENGKEEKSNNNNAVGAAVGIGAAAAIIGAIALAHKSHHHDDDDKHKDDAKQEAEYERGYRDGLYNSSFHDYSNTEDYRKGYESGVRQRRQETSYSSGYGGYKPFVNVLNLIGERASSGESELQSRGFRNVQSFKAGAASYTYWYNSSTRQCIQVATVDGRFSTVLDVPTHAECR